MDTLTLTSERILYKGYTIEIDLEDGPGKFIAYPTEEGRQHDGDCDQGSWKYCGNCKWGSTVEDVQLEIDEHLASSLEDLQKSREVAQFYLNAPGYESQKDHWQKTLNDIIKETNQVYERYRSEAT